MQAFLLIRQLEKLCEAPLTEARGYLGRVGQGQEAS